VPLTALYSTLGRTAARTLETKIIADAMQGMCDGLVANVMDPRGVELVRVKVL